MHWDPFLQRGGGGSIVARLWQTRWDPPRRPQGGAQPVVDRPVRADPFWTHSLLTIWENMLVQKHHIRFRVILHEPVQKLSHFFPMLTCTCA